MAILVNFKGNCEEEEDTNQNEGEHDLILSSY